jgi:hypothetical protein
MQLTDPTNAYHVAVAPSEYSESVVDDLIERGYDACGDGEAGKDFIIESLNTYAEAALKSGTDSSVSVSLPLLESPAVLVTISTLVAERVLDLERFEDTPQRNIAPYAMVREFTTENMAALVRQQDDTLIQDLAEYIFEKPPGESGIHPGRVCTGVTRRSDLGQSDTYLEIPLVAASNQCYKKTRTNGHTRLHAHIKDNTLYVPIDWFFERFTEDWSDEFETLVDHRDRLLDPEHRAWLAQHVDSVDETVTRWVEHGHHHHLYEGWDPDKEKLNLLVRAIQEVPDETADLSSPLRAAAITNALELYKPDDWERHYLTELDSSKRIASFLQTQADSHQVEIQSGDNLDFNLYELQPTNASSSQNLDVTHVEDLLELPCFEAMFDHFEENGPVHEELLNFAGTAKWLERYHHAPDGKFVSEMKEMFSQFSWYDPDITEYQSQYEPKRTDEDGTPYNPKKCRNDDMQRWCVGLHICPYSIYGSLPFAQELYDNLDDE